MSKASTAQRGLSLFALALDVAHFLCVPLDLRNFRFRHDGLPCQDLQVLCVRLMGDHGLEDVDEPLQLRLNLAQLLCHIVSELLALDGNMDLRQGRLVFLKLAQLLAWVRLDFLELLLLRRLLRLLLLLALLGFLFDDRHQLRGG